MIPGFISLHEIIEGWNDLFFSDQPTLTICVLRLLTGLLVLLETGGWMKYRRQFLSPKGWFGYRDYAARLDPPRFSLLNYLPPSETSVTILIALQLTGGLCLMLGILPQLSALVCFLTLVSIHNRNIYVLNSGDTVRRYLCLFLIFAPSGGQLSILSPGQLLDPEAAGWPWTLLMIRFFMANIYLKNVLFKLLGPHWRNGTATRMVLGVRTWTRLEVPAIIDHTWFYRATTYGTLLVETALFTLIWIEEFRWAVLITGVLFHLGLWLFLRIRLFQITMIAGLAAFVTPEEYARFFEWIGRMI